LAQPEGYIRSFVDEGEAMRSMLVQLVGRQNMSPPGDKSTRYIQTLLKAFPKIGFDEKGGKPVAGKGAALFSITPREIEVLKLLDQGLTYSEIAERLKISENTLKFHIKNVYGKLQVDKRIKAVAKAKTLGYL